MNDAQKRIVMGKLINRHSYEELVVIGQLNGIEPPNEVYETKAELLKYLLDKGLQLYS